MEKLEKIFELIEKSSETKLSVEEENSLNNLINSDKEAEQFVKTYNTLKKSFSASFHPDEELLASYILFEKNQLIENNIVSLLSEKIKKHIDGCLLCKENYNTLKMEYDDVNDYVTKRFEVNDTAPAKKPVARIFPLFATKPIFKLAYAAMLVIGIIYVGLFAVSDISTPAYVDQILNDENQFYVTRGRTSLFFQKGLDAIENKKWDQAISYLKEDISNHAGEGSIFYTHYVLGLTYLNSSGSDFLGLFKSFDSEKVKLAINSLNKSVEKNTSGNYENVNLDAHYYLGLAYLLLDELDNARINLNIVIDQKGRFYRNAQTLLSSITEKSAEKN